MIGAGRRASASLVLRALMPSPPTMTAMRGAVLAIGRQLARLGVARERARAVARDLRDAAVRRHFQQPPVDRRLRPVNARNHHLVVLAAGAVDDGDGLQPGGGAGVDRAFGRDRRDCNVRAARRCVMLAAVAAAGRVLAVERRPGGDHRHRLAAERIVGEQRPAHRHQPEQAEHAGQQLRRAERQLRQLRGLLLPFLAERGVQVVIRGHGPNPRESSAESSTRDSGQVNSAYPAGCIRLRHRYGQTKTGRPVGRPVGTGNRCRVLSSGPAPSGSAGTPN